MGREGEGGPNPLRRRSTATARRARSRRPRGELGPSAPPTSTTGAQATPASKTRSAATHRPTRVPRSSTARLKLLGVGCAEHRFGEGPVRRGRRGSSDPTRPAGTGRRYRRSRGPVRRTGADAAARCGSGRRRWPTGPGTAGRRPRGRTAGQARGRRRAGNPPPRDDQSTGRASTPSTSKAHRDNASAVANTASGSVSAPHRRSSMLSRRPAPPTGEASEHPPGGTLPRRDAGSHTSGRGPNLAPATAPATTPSATVDGVRHRPLRRLSASSNHSRAQTDGKVGTAAPSPRQAGGQVQQRAALPTTLARWTIQARHSGRERAGAVVLASGPRSVRRYRERGRRRGPRRRGRPGGGRSRTSRRWGCRRRCASGGASDHQLLVPQHAASRRGPASPARAVRPERCRYALWSSGGS